MSIINFASLDLQRLQELTRTCCPQTGPFKRTISQIELNKIGSSCAAAAAAKRHKHTNYIPILVTVIINYWTNSQWFVVVVASCSGSGSGLGSGSGRMFQRDKFKVGAEVYLVTDVGDLRKGRFDREEEVVGLFYLAHWALRRHLGNRSTLVWPTKVCIAIATGDTFSINLVQQQIKTNKLAIMIGEERERDENLENRCNLSVKSSSLNWGKLTRCNVVVLRFRNILEKH